MRQAVRILLTAASAVALMAATYVVGRYNPETAGFYPQCPSKLLTGYECPGCGSLRGIHALLNGNFAETWRFNPAIYFALALIAAIGMAGIHRTEAIASRMPCKMLHFSRRVARITDHYAFPLSILAATIIWTIVRNL